MMTSDQEQSNEVRTTLRLPRDVYDDVVAWAEASRRSLNAQIVYVLENEVRDAAIRRDRQLERREHARRLQLLVALAALPDETFDSGEMKRNPEFLDTVVTAQNYLKTLLGYDSFGDLWADYFIGR